MTTDAKTRYERGLDVCKTLAGSAEAGEGMAAFFRSRGAVGDIALHGHPPSLFRGYWKEEAATRRTRRGDWYVTGDRATLIGGGIRGQVTGDFSRVFGNFIGPTPGFG